MKSVAAIPEVFRFADLLDLGLDPRALRQLVRSGKVEKLGRGLYRRTDAPEVDVDRLEVAVLAPMATMCLGSALAEHGLSDEIPDLMDLALPRGKWRPVLTAPVGWHTFDADTFEVGRMRLPVANGVGLWIYSPERTLIDVFRMSHVEGADKALEALRRWVRQRGSQPGELLMMATESFPRTAGRLRAALEVLG